MELVIRFGADKRKQKIIEDQIKQIKELEEQIKSIKLDLVYETNEKRKLKKRNTYLEKKVGNKNVRGIQEVK